MLSVDASKYKSKDVMFRIQFKNKYVDKSVESSFNNVTDSTLKSDTTNMAYNSKIGIVFPGKFKNIFMSLISSKNIEKNLQSEIQNSQENNCENNYWFKKPNQNEVKFFLNFILFNQNFTTYTVRNYINENMAF